MTKPPQQKPKKPERLEDVEVEPGAWERFERAVDAAVKSGPKHKSAKKEPKDD